VTTPVDWYISRATLKALLRDDRPSPNPFDDAYDTAIQAASRSIDEHCDDQFWMEPTAIERTFRPDDVRVLWPGSFASTTGMVVKFDLDDDGVFETTLLSSDWQAGQTNRRADRPFDRIELLTPGGRFPGAWRGDPYSTVYGGNQGYGLFSTYGYAQDVRFRSLRARVSVTAHWGWPSVPWQVKQAAQILAIQNFKSKDMTGTTAGTPMTSGGSFGAQAAYQVRSGAGMNASAAALLCGLRDVVIA
jgi:hypothetical protein